MGNIAKRREAGGHQGGRVCRSAAAAAFVLAACGSAGAFEIKTGNEDLSVNWDNTFRYSYGHRVKGQSPTIIKSANFDDGDRNFDVGMVMNRLDILSELTMVYKKDFGIKLSGAGWYDQRYSMELDNNNVSSSNFRDSSGNQAIGLSSKTKDRHKGPNGELLDAFVTAKFEAGDIPVYLKVGRSISYWGEGLLNPIHAISYGQFPIDFAKAIAMPGVEVKELFRPLNNVTLTTNLTDTLTLSGQYFLQWEPYEYPESGSYMAAFDFFHRGASSIILAPGFSIPIGGFIEPKQARDFGVSARWKPDWLTGTLGFYYRNFSDKQPQLGLLMNGSTPQSLMFSYPSGIELFGVSLAKNIGPVAIGSEISYRTNMPLNSNFGIAGSTAQLPGTGDTFGARGKTIHALINGMYLISKTAFWDLGVLMGEFDYNRLDAVTSNSPAYAGYNTVATLDRPTRDYMEGSLNFTPTWYQVIPGVDLSMPLSITSGLTGNSPVMFGGNKHSGSYGFGFSADIFQQYKADIKYAGYFGPMDEDPATGGIKSAAGNAYNKDRGTITFTLKATF